MTVPLCLADGQPLVDGAFYRGLKGGKATTVPVFGCRQCITAFRGERGTAHEIPLFNRAGQALTNEDLVERTAGPTTPLESTMRTCSVPGCSEVNKARERCAMHYNLAYKGGWADGRPALDLERRMVQLRWAKSNIAAAKEELLSLQRRGIIIPPRGVDTWIDQTWWDQLAATEAQAAASPELEAPPSSGPMTTAAGGSDDRAVTPEPSSSTDAPVLEEGRGPEAPGCTGSIPIEGVHTLRMTVVGWDQILRELDTWRKTATDEQAERIRLEGLLDRAHEETAHAEQLAHVWQERLEKAQDCIHTLSGRLVATTVLERMHPRPPGVGFVVDHWRQLEWLLRDLASGQTFLTLENGQHTLHHKAS